MLTVGSTRKFTSIPGHKEVSVTIDIAAEMFLPSVKVAYDAFCYLCVMGFKH